MKRTGLLVLSFLLLLTVLSLSACGGGKSDLVEGKVNVVTSFYPLYDFAQKIGGDNVHVINVVPAGVEPHDWSPKSKDVSQIAKADLFVYHGAGFEGWVPDFLNSLQKDAKVRAVEASAGINLLKSSEKAESGEFDPHTWLSPLNAKKIAENIKNALVETDAAHKADYEANFAKFASQLDQLDKDYKDAFAKLPGKDIVVSHDAFAYLSRDYGLTQKPIAGLSPESEPTAQDMKEINNFVKANKVKYIFFEELVSDKLAKTLAKDAGIETLVLNPLEGLTDKEIKAGEDYISVMRKNLLNLVKALQ